MGRKSRFSPLTWIFVVLLVAGGYLGLAWLEAAGRLDLGVTLPGAHELFGDEEEAQRDRGDLVAVPISARAIPAYAKVTRDDLWSVKNGRLATLQLPENSVPPGALTELRSIIGRVLDHEKPAGYVFTESDFLPPETRAGLVAGVPEDKVMMLVEADKVQGLHGLEPGDRFDIIRTIPVDAKSRDAVLSGAGPYAAQLELELKLQNWSKQAAVKVIVEDGRIVSPVRTRAKPVSSRSLTSGLSTKTVPVQELYIAIAPSEVAHLSEAIAVDADVRAVVRSGRPDAPEVVATSERRPANPFVGLVSGLTRSWMGEGADVGPAGDDLDESQRRGVAGLRLVEVVDGRGRRFVPVPSAPAPGRIAGVTEGDARIVPTSGPDAEREDAR